MWFSEQWWYERQNIPPQNPEQLPYNTNPREGMSQEELVNDWKEFLIAYNSSELAIRELERDLQEIHTRYLENWKSSIFGGKNLNTVAKQMLIQRIDNINNTKINIRKWKPTSHRDGRMKLWKTLPLKKHPYLPNEYNSKPNKIILFEESRPWTAVHELVHSSTNANFLIDPTTWIQLDLYNLPWVYLDSRTEKHARIISTKYYLKKFRICDPCSEKITVEHLEELKKYKHIDPKFCNKRDNFYDLLRNDENTLEDLSKLLNSIVQNNQQIDPLENIV